MKASHILSRVGFMVSMVATGQDGMLGSKDFSRERDELEDECEALVRERSKVEEELVKLQKKAKLGDSF